MLGDIVMFDFTGNVWFVKYINKNKNLYTIDIQTLTKMTGAQASYVMQDKAAFGKVIVESMDRI